MRKMSSSKATDDGTVLGVLVLIGLRLDAVNVYCSPIREATNPAYATNGVFLEFSTESLVESAELGWVKGVEEAKKLRTPPLQEVLMALQNTCLSLIHI